MSYMLKLLICYHKKDVLLKDDVLTPIHVGRALARERLGENSPQFKWFADNMIGDDTGENISRKNSSYNELTAVYWAWKNYDKLGDPDYIGLMHYRRHFIFRESVDVVEDVRGIDENYFKRINYAPETVAHLFDDCDYVAHIGHVDEVYKHYKENHHIADLDLAISILKEKYPKYAPTADAYLKMSYVNLCNMFIMPRKMFFEYCSWLFDILEEFERRVDLSDKRLFISERLTGIFIEHQKRNGLKQKSLSATFIQAETRVPVVMPYNGARMFPTIVSMAAIIKNAAEDTLVDFYMLHRTEDDIENSPVKEIFIKDKSVTVNFVNVDKYIGCNISDSRFDQLRQNYPFVVSQLIPDINKAIYLDENVLFLKDIGEFYRVCNNDEFALITLPKEKFIGLEHCLCSINCRRMRSLFTIDEVIKGNAGDASAQIENKGQAGSFAWWLYCVARFDGKGADALKNWNEIKKELPYRSALVFSDDALPWCNLQMPWAAAWWDVACSLSGRVKIDCIEVDDFQAFELQCASLAEKCVRRRYGAGNSSIFIKTLKYYRANGLKKTINKVITKLLRRA